MPALIEQVSPAFETASSSRGWFPMFSPRRSGFEGDVVSKMDIEAAQAVLRFKGAYVERHFQDWLMPAMTQGDLRRYAAETRLDFDALVDGAARHFASPVVHQRTEPLSAKELEFLFEDDQRAIGG